PSPLFLNAPPPTQISTLPYTTLFRSENHPFVEDFKFVRDHVSEGIEAKQTFPAPAQLLAELYRPENIEATQAVYSSEDGLVNDVDRKSTRLNSSHVSISYAVFCLKKN